jgi:hypothetical protein
MKITSIREHPSFALEPTPRSAHPFQEGMETENLLWGGVPRRREVGTQSADKEINEPK